MSILLLLLSLFFRAAAVVLPFFLIAQAIMCALISITSINDMKLFYEWMHLKEA